MSACLFLSSHLSFSHGSKFPSLPTSSDQVASGNDIVGGMAGMGVVREGPLTHLGAGLLVMLRGFTDSPSLGRLPHGPFCFPFLVSSFPLFVTFQQPLSLLWASLSG